jgi:signal transduction histidine kinase
MSVRNLAYDLRPRGLQELGLLRTVHQHCKEFSLRHRLQLDFFSAGMDHLKLDPDIEITLYRLLQEALNNVVKHARATRISVRLVASFPKIILRVEDNGRGFDVLSRLEEAAGERRMGIPSMEERLALINGMMRLESAPGIGTRVVIDVPYKERSVGR